MHITYRLQLRAIALLFLFVTCFPCLVLLQLLPTDSNYQPYLLAFALLCTVMSALLASSLALNTVREHGDHLTIRSGFFHTQFPLNHIERVQQMSWAEWLCSHSQPMKRQQGMEFLDCQTGWFEQADGRKAFLMVFADDPDITVVYGQEFDLILSGLHPLPHNATSYKAQRV